MTAAARAKAIRDYTALHEGLPPKELICEPVPETPSKPRVLGRATEIIYKKDTPNERARYRHPWASQAQPTIAVDRNGKLWFYAGKHETRKRGIEDRVVPGQKPSPYLAQPYVRPERLPPVPKSLTTLGTLEQIRYKGDGRVRTLKFPATIAPVIAHDTQGNLHVLRGQYVITNEGDVAPMFLNPRRRRRSRRHSYMNAMSYDNPRHRRRRSRRRHRRNPFLNPTRRGRATTQHAGRMALNSLAVGGVAALTFIAADAGVAYLMPAQSVPVKALAKIAGGLLLGFGASLLQPQVGAGIAIGGVTDGAVDLWRAYVTPQIAALQAPAVVTPTAPGGQVLMPGGIPAAYAGYSPAACAVR
jgi:hypothetical protein